MIYSILSVAGQGKQQPSGSSGHNVILRWNMCEEPHNAVLIWQDPYQITSSKNKAINANDNIKQWYC